MSWGLGDKQILEELKYDEAYQEWCSQLAFEFVAWQQEQEDGNGNRSSTTA